ncbi:helix-hairpin-helix domain-containing protein [Kitasatospora sp. NPDC048194]|uniref:helix-hairpin-helix domain-containing protein n=1 Tax=Kitasatospora sp. NPDC048194 TaxID=3364045 RepID=UPI003715AC6E
MTTLNLGAAKRQTINETVRLRMAALLQTDDEPAGGEPTGDEPVDGERLGSERAAAERAAGGRRGGSRAAGERVGEGGVVGERAADSSAGLSPPSVPSPAASLAAPPPAIAGVAPPEAVHLAEPPPTGGAPPRFAAALALDRRAVAGLAILLLFAVGYAVQHFWLARPEAVAVPALAAASAPSEPGLPASSSPAGAVASAGAATAPGSSGAGPPEVPAGQGAGGAVVVDIGGRVHLPGLHTLPGGSRVADALRAAGGPLPDTDTRGLNLARLLADGEQILVGEPAPVPAPAPVSGGGNGPSGGGTPRPPVSLNRATLEQLDTLPGVGPTLAQRILAYRTSHGSFRTVDQLRQVSGIGARTFAELRPLLTL